MHNGITPFNNVKPRYSINKLVQWNHDHFIYKIHYWLQINTENRSNKYDG